MHPTITRGVDECGDVKLENVFGLIKSNFALSNKKINLSLCRSCAENLEDFCTHDDEGRALYGTWTSIEIHKAIEHGYKIITVYEIYHYENRKKIFDIMLTHL